MKTHTHIILRQSIDLSSSSFQSERRHKSTYTKHHLLFRFFTTLHQEADGAARILHFQIDRRSRSFFVWRQSIHGNSLGVLCIVIHVDSSVSRPSTGGHWTYQLFRNRSRHPSRVTSLSSVSSCSPRFLFPGRRCNVFSLSAFFTFQIEFNSTSIYSLKRSKWVFRSDSSAVWSRVMTFSPQKRSIGF